MRREASQLEALQRFLVGAGLPVFGLSVLLFYELVLVTLLFVPAGETGLAAFAEEFRVWCFGYDPATGQTDWAFVLGMTGPPVLVGAIFAVLWWAPLRTAMARPVALARPVLAAAAVVAAAVGGFSFAGSASDGGELPFPAEALRTAHPAPDFVLTSQTGEPLDLGALRGDVVVLTAVYASCPHTCPLILAQARRAIGELSPSERADLRLVAVTLDPANDSPESLARLARMHGLEPPLYNFVTGEVAEVERILDAMGVARHRVPETGLIEHANLFLLLDRAGHVAYRLTLGERQERWMISALRVLLGEATALE